MNNKINFSVYLMLVIVLFGCKSIDIKDVKKQLVLPGYNLGKTKLKYSTTITSKEDFKIMSLKIDKIDKEFKSFSIIELPTGKLKNVDQKLVAGSYFIELSISENLVSKESVDIVTLTISINNKLLAIKSKTFLDKNVLGR
jgi:hypothetical protein